MITMDDNYKFEDFGLICEVGHTHPEPSMDNRTLVISGRDGLWDFGSEMRERPFTFPMGIIENNRQEKQKKLRDFTAFLRDSNGKPREIKISYDYEPDKHYMVKCNAPLSPERLINAGRFVLSFVAYDPWAYATATQYDQPPVNYDTGVTYDSGLMYANPEAITWSYTKQYSGLHNYSHYNTPFSFMIEGAVINPRITNTTTGKTTLINVTLASDERLYVDSKRYQAWRVKTEVDVHGFMTPSFMIQSTKEQERMNLFNEVAGDFPELISGDNGLLFEGGAPNAVINFDWKHKFM